MNAYDSSKLQNRTRSFKLLNRWLVYERIWQFKIAKQNTTIQTLNTAIQTLNISGFYKCAIKFHIDFLTISLA